MFAIDRLDTLCRHYRFIHTGGRGSLHRTLDTLDRMAHIETSGGSQYAVFSARRVPINPVGARLALHEKHLAQPRRSGYMACSCGCGCHRRT